MHVEPLWEKVAQIVCALFSSVTYENGLNNACQDVLY